jgi:hypothetical protein
MSSEVSLFSSRFLCHPDSDPPPEDAGDGIWEVVTVPSADELPYVFELTAGQRLSVSLSASANIDLVLCDEAAYDCWLDSGLETEHPPNPLLALRPAEHHSLEYKAANAGSHILVLINLADAPVDVVVAATISG